MNEIHNLEIANSGILVLYNMSSLFTNIPLDEAIKVLTNKAFTAFSFQLSQLSAFTAFSAFVWFTKNTRGGLGNVSYTISKANIQLCLSFQLSQLLAHLYGLPKTHEEGLAMCPILSAKQTYNYA